MRETSEPQTKYTPPPRLAESSDDAAHRQILPPTTTMTVISNTIRVASRRAVSSRRNMSDAAGGPRMHKAKDTWKELQATRPPVGHPHVRRCN